MNWKFSPYGTLTAIKLGETSPPGHLFRLKENE